MSKAQGDIAEITFLLKAKKLGLTCLTPYSAITPYDIVVDTGSRLIKVQVKSSNTNMTRNGRRYDYKYKVGLGKGKHSKTRYNQNEVDIFAVYIIPEDTFYIIPFGAVRTINIYIHTDKNDHTFSKYRENFDLIK
jgi:hypothetical protein